MTGFSIPARSAISISALCYGIVLAAWDRGLGSVINGQGITRSDIVREVANIPEDQVIMTCVAMGYPDDEFSRQRGQIRPAAERRFRSLRRLRTIRLSSGSPFRA